MRRVLGAAASILAVTAAIAADEPPPGIVVGVVILQPVLEIGGESTTNPFYEPPERDPQADDILTTGVGLAAIIPFRESRVDLAAGYRRYDYRTSVVDRDDEVFGRAAVDLAFSTFDHLELAVERQEGLAQATLVDPGGEFTFDGQPFATNMYAARAWREEPGRRGYEVRASHTDLNFEEGVDVQYFDYRGLDLSAEYREPLNPRLWLTATYAGRRYNQYLTTDPPGTLFREEISDMVYAGFRGLAGPRRSFFGRIGWGDFRFPGGTASDYSGVVADGGVRWTIGTRAVLEGDVWQLPYPSLFANQNYFLTRGARAGVRYVATRRFTVGGSFSWSRARYGDPLVNPGDPQEGLIREDDRTAYLVYANLQVRNTLGLRAEARRESRDSNYEGVGYDLDSLFVGVSLGWIER